ncbi:hypothetical protein BZZ01_30135 [Nostocales cyanobacterium HT-58-2]|nr:hypothetical protein BZZ01_30135 [Nostocales cyanobacterium HT-58-2]
MLGGWKYRRVLMLVSTIHPVTRNTHVLNSDRKQRKFPALLLSFFLVKVSVDPHTVTAQALAAKTLITRIKMSIALKCGMIVSFFYAFIAQKM